MKLDRIIYAFLLIAGISILAGCGNSASKKLDIAERVVEERPDSAQILLDRMVYFYLDDDQKAKYILVKAMADAATGRSLVTDSLLPMAMEHYKVIGDSMRWLKANLLYISYLHVNNRPEEAVKTIDGMLAGVPADSIDRQYQLRQMRMHMLALAGNYADALHEADWLVEHTVMDKVRFRNAGYRMYLLYKLGRLSDATAYGDTIAESDFIPEKYTAEWNDFMGDFAELLDEDSRSAKAIAIVEDIISGNPGFSNDQLVTYYVSLAKYNANSGNLSKAKMWLSAIDSIGYDPLMVEAGFDRYLNFLRSSIEFKETGHLSNLPDKELSYEVFRQRKINEDAIAEMNNLSAWKIQLTLERRNIAIILLSVCLILLIISFVLFLLLSRRRKRLVEAEEEIETLNGMIREVKRADETESDTHRNTALKRMILQQMGILKVFAASPTKQNEDVLRKISSIGSDDGDTERLVNWSHLYEMIDGMYDGFYSALLKTYPDKFTEKELQIICLLLAEFSTKEIGVLTRQSSATIYVRKSAIRKKISAPEGADIIVRLREVIPPLESV